MTLFSFYAGGEKSGMAIEFPDGEDKNKAVGPDSLVSKIFSGASQNSRDQQR